MARFILADFQQRLEKKGFKPSYDAVNGTLSLEINKKSLPFLKEHERFLEQAIKKHNEGKAKSDQLVLDRGEGPHPDPEKTLAYYRLAYGPRRPRNS